MLLSVVKPFSLQTFLLVSSAIVCCQTIFSSNIPSSILGYCLLSNHFIFKLSLQYPRLLSVVNPFSLQTFLLVSQAIVCSQTISLQTFFLVSQAIVCCQTIFSSNFPYSILGYCLLSNHFLFKLSFEYPRLLSVLKPILFKLSFQYPRLLSVVKPCLFKLSIEYPRLLSVVKPFLFKLSFEYPRLLSVVKPFSLQTFLLVSQAIVCCQTIFSSNVSLSILLFTEILFLSQ